MFRRILLLLLVMMVGPRGHAQDGMLRIAAAADLQPVLPSLIDQFEKQTQKKVEASYASSATLATQIINGGPFGLFLSADVSFPQKVIAAGLGIAPNRSLMRGARWYCGRATIRRLNRLAWIRCAVRR